MTHLPPALNTDPSRKEHLRYLDSLRGFAALSIIMVHCCYSLKLDGIAGTLGMAGQRGVQLFYIISAFTLCYSFDARRNEEEHPLRNYFIRRFFRIAPLFYLAIIARLFYQGLAPREEAPFGLSVWEILSGVVFLNGFHPYTINSIVVGGWSVAVETSFYVVLPFLLAFVRSLRAAFFLLILCLPVAGIVSHRIAHLSDDPLTKEYFQFLWFPVEFPIFVMGIFTYFLWRSYGKERPRNGNALSLFLIAGSVLIFCASLPITNNKLYWASFAFVPLLLGLSLHEWKLLVNPLTVYLGKISYSIYLCQFFFIRALPAVWHYAELRVKFEPLGSLPICLLTFLAVSLCAIAVSTLTYHFIEKPGIQWGGILIRRWEHKAISGRI